MTLEKPLWQQAAGGDPTIEYSAVRDRALIRALFHNEGIVAPDVVFGALKVSQRGAGANFSVDTAVGAAVIEGDDVADQGYYLIQSTAVENRTIPSPPVSGTRVHRVVARVKDKLHNGSWSTYEWIIEVLEDTGSGTPATPASAISLATVSVAAGQASVLNSHITDTRLSAGLITSKFPLVGADSARPPAPFESELIYRTDGKYYEFHNGTSWRAIPSAPGPDLFARKTANTTRNNTGSLTADPHLTVSVVANATYLLEAFLMYQSVSSSPDIAFGWTAPSGATVAWTPLGLTPTDGDQAPTQQAGYVRMPGTDISTQRSLGTQASNDLVAAPRGIVRTAASAGSLTLRWAQNTAVAENTTLMTDSWVYLRRVA